MRTEKFCRPRQLPIVLCLLVNPGLDAPHDIFHREPARQQGGMNAEYRHFFSCCRVGEFSAASILYQRAKPAFALE